MVCVIGVPSWQIILHISCTSLVVRLCLALLNRVEVDTQSRLLLGTQIAGHVEYCSLSKASYIHVGKP